MADVSDVRGAKSTVARSPRVALVGDSVSLKFGGEAVHPIHYFRLLRARGIDAYLIAHSRTKDELLRLFPDDHERIFLVPDTWAHRICAKITRYLPGALGQFTVGQVKRLLTQRTQRRLIRELVAKNAIDLVHMPIPIAVKELSLIYNVGVPVVFGPLNGAMTFPPAFRRRRNRFDAVFMKIGNVVSSMAMRVFPGRLRAAVVLVANPRSRHAIPAATKGWVVSLIDNCVDLDVWKSCPRFAEAKSPVRFVFVSRFVAWKGPDLLLEAFALAVKRIDKPNLAISLDFIGDGEMAAELKRKTTELGLDPHVCFRGWMSASQIAAALKEMDVFVFPSLFDCGGAVVQEAMAVNLPVIAAKWGGPADYIVDNESGLLIDPTDHATLVTRLADAMLHLAVNPSERVRLGNAARRRVEAEYDWQRKIDRILDIYRDALGSS